MNNSGALLVLSIAALCLLSMTHVSSASDPSPPPNIVGFFKQTLDHFNSSDTRTFQQKYLIYSKHWEAAGKPDLIFAGMGGEAPVRGGYDHDRMMFDFAETVGALVIFPEHRFYGDSLPAGPVDSFEPSMIQYLTVQQALADYEAILRALVRDYGMAEDTTIITLGGSYPGELAAFFRIQSPDFIYGALASSAPIRYHPGLMPPSQTNAFYAVATQAFAQQHPECPDISRRAFSDLLRLMQQGESGREQVAAQLSLCSVPDEGPQQLRLLEMWIQNAFAGLAMENYPYPVGPSPAWPMRVACEAAYQLGAPYDPTKESGATPLQRMAAALSVEYNTTGTLSCFNVTNEFFPCADLTGCGAPGPDAYSWDYQSCTQLVSNVDTNNITDCFPPWPYNYTAIVEYCKQRWNATPDPLFLWHRYPLSEASRIIFSNGFADPWFPGGILNNQSSTVIALQATEAAHHFDLRGNDPRDPSPVRVLRSREQEILSRWINEANTARQQKKNQLSK